MRRRFWLAWALVVGCAPLAACSYAFVKPPPPVLKYTYRSTEACTRSAAVPVIDSVLAAGAIGAGAVLMASSGGADQRPGLAPGLGVIIVGTMFTASAINGHIATAECRERYERPWKSEADSKLPTGAPAARPPVIAPEPSPPAVAPPATNPPAAAPDTAPPATTPPAANPPAATPDTNPPAATPNTAPPATAPPDTSPPTAAPPRASAPTVAPPSASPPPVAPPRSFEPSQVRFLRNPLGAPFEPSQVRFLRNPLRARSTTPA